MTVKFNDVNEFLTELECDLVHIDRQIVRTTYTMRGTQMHTTILTVTATARVAGELVRCDEEVGELWGAGNAGDRAVREKAQSLRNVIDAFAKRNGLDVRHGILD